MKILSIFLLAFTFSNSIWATVEYGTLDVAGGNTSLVLNQGDVFEVTNFDGMYSHFNGNKDLFYFTAPDGSNRLILYTASSTTRIFSKYITIYGPTIITLAPHNTEWLMFKLTKAPNPLPAVAATIEN